MCKVKLFIIGWAIGMVYGIWFAPYDLPILGISAVLYTGFLWAMIDGIRKTPQRREMMDNPYEIRTRCPKWGCPLIRDDEIDAVWCTFIGSRRHNEPACDFSLDLRPYEKAKEEG